ncbi:MAG: phosphate/phosphite/phosphonate ABC transporter substrate-binding protein [Actinophytocola sp.]|nr:phosphate/phosphite/phosphonate ABC transporter substrate-binding protein [Actinophytocola sp.]
MYRPVKRGASLSALSAIAALVLAACGDSAADSGSSSGDSDELVFAAVPSEEATGLQAAYEPIIALLERETGKQVTFQKATDYAAIIEGQRAGKIDIAQYGPFSYVLATDSGVETTPVGAQVEEKNERPGYKSYGITKAGSGIDSLDDYQGKKVCFVDPASTSGYLYPSAGLLDAGVDPKQDVTPVMAGGHDASAIAVAKGQCDAGFAYDSMVTEQLIESGQLAKGDLDVVWKSEMIMSSPLAVSDDLSPELKDTIATVIQEKANVDYLESNGMCGGDCAIGEEGSWGYTKVDDSAYAGVRRVCETLGEACKEAS